MGRVNHLFDQISQFVSLARPQKAFRKTACDPARGVSCRYRSGMEGGYAIAELGMDTANVITGFDGG